MKRLSTILKNSNTFDIVAYVYRTGIVLVKSDKKSNLSKYYYIKKKYNMPKDVARIVLHDPHDILCFGTDFTLSFYENNTSPWSKDKGIDFRLTSFNFSHGGKIPVEEYKEKESPYWNSRGNNITVQGKGYWSNNGIDWKENEKDAYSDNYPIEEAWYSCYEPEEISG